MIREEIKLLVINPGSTSTKVAVFINEEKASAWNISHKADELARFKEIPDQKAYRRDMILATLHDNGFRIRDMDAFVGRGGGMVSCRSGTYPVEGILLKHASTCYAAKHPSVLGAVLAREFADRTGKPAFIVNPPDVDELCDEARMTGIRGVYRQSRFHALNQKEIGHRAAGCLGKHYEETNLIIAHIGGGISIAAHRKGSVVDVNDIINGDGPMAPTRCGAIPVSDMIRVCFSGTDTQESLKDLTRKNGGLVNHLGTSDTIEIEKRAKEGDSYAKLVYDAMIYQIGKQIGSMAAALSGDVDAVVLTGGIVHSAYVSEKLEKMCSFIAPVFRFPGEMEMEALASGALRVLKGEESLKHYTGVPVFTGFDF